MYRQATKTKTKTKGTINPKPKPPICLSDCLTVHVLCLTSQS